MFSFRLRGRVSITAPTLFVVCRLTGMKFPLAVWFAIDDDCWRTFGHLYHGDCVCILTPDFVMRNLIRV